MALSTSRAVLLRALPVQLGHRVSPAAAATAASLSSWATASTAARPSLPCPSSALATRQVLTPWLCRGFQGRAVSGRLDEIYRTNFRAGRRDFEVALRRSADSGQQFVKISEFSGAAMSSVLVHVRDVAALMAEFARLDETRPGAGIPLSGGQDVLNSATVRCSFDNSRVFEMSFNENRLGQFYRLREMSSESRGKGRMIMMEHSGKDDFLTSLQEVLSKADLSENALEPPKPVAKEGSEELA